MKNKDSKKISKKLLILIALLIIFILVIAVVSNKEVQEMDELTKIPAEIDNVDELLTHFNCKNITIKDSDEEPFKKDIFLTFGEDLWINNKSNEAYYNEIVLYVSSLLDYNSFRMIDSTRELVVATIANNQTKKVTKIYINGQSDYFEKRETEESIKNYKKPEEVQINVQAKEIIDLISNNWEANKVSFGTRESRCDDYDIYFDEGIEVKTLGGKVYNIVFTEKYKSSVVNDIIVNSSREDVQNVLGKPTFENRTVYGYKAKNVYVFFSQNAISVYRVESDYKTEQFLKLLDSFEENKDAKTFTNGLTSLWKDYNEYNYDKDYIYLEYALRGLRLQFNVSGENGIIIYSNYDGNITKDITLENLNLENLPEHVYIHSDEDLVFLRETDRANLQITYSSEEYMSMSDEKETPRKENVIAYSVTPKHSEEFFTTYKYTEDGISDMKIISRNREYPNSEIIRHKDIYRFGWINSEELIYSVKGVGIYKYNAKTRELKSIITGNESFELKRIEGNTLYYDNTKIDV